LGVCHSASADSRKARLFLKKVRQHSLQKLFNLSRRGVWIDRGFDGKAATGWKSLVTSNTTGDVAEAA